MSYATRMNFNQLFTVDGPVMTPNRLVNIMGVFRGGAEMSMSHNSINGVDLLSWQGKDLLVEVRQFAGQEEHYILGLAVQ
ncbi:hypothetical protein [Spirosoma rhododendri]|uniref:Uncharacterized protein n=1 Tax=Spirosoma rhododendri TaxID=2728024 RepID=A0A7L5DVL8_9BACT|nr:hypothetical protein [Spirosoma rhododendri]QJD81521.1 hypothetical protein HH216_24425 [Spirosoma rhododendri]